MTIDRDFTLRILKILMIIGVLFALWYAVTNNLPALVGQNIIHISQT